MLIPTDIPSAVTLAEATALAELARGKRVLEVGADRGFSTIVLASTAVELVSVDWFQGDAMAGQRDALAEYWANLARYGVRGGGTTTFIGDAAQVYPKLRPGYFDLVFIDAFHEEEYVWNDAIQSLELVQPDGVMAFHDYGRFTVAPAVDRLVESTSSTLEVVEYLAIVRLGAAKPKRTAKK